MGRKEFVVHELDSRATCHAELLEKIPFVKDLQCAWLILLRCGVSRTNFSIRAVNPDSLQFATRHEAQIWRYLTTLVGVLPEAVPESVRAAATLPLSSGGLGCRNSVRLRHSWHRASWAVNNSARPSTLALDIWKKQVLWPQIGFNFASIQAPDVVDEEDPNQPRKGGQAAVSRVVVTQVWDGLLPTLSKRDATLLRSQAGPLESIPLHGVSHGSFVSD